MATWKRFFNTPEPISYNNSKSNATGLSYSNFTSGLKDYYTGPANRLERYNQYDILDRDPIVSAALNVIAEFCTQENEYTKLPLYINYVDESNETEVVVLKETLKRWMYINDLRKRLFYIIRNTLKYGDTFYVRDPETYELHYVDPRNVEKISVDNNDGKKIHSYFIRNISFNLSQKILTHDTGNAQQNYTGLMQTQAYKVNTHTNSNSSTPSTEILAKHVVQLSLNSTGMDYINWPFSSSILESVYKPAKQKELLENAYLIYKVQRAPERRVFYIYTGDANSTKAMEHIERVKNEMHQRRIPSRTGGGASILDSTYDPLSMLDDYYMPVNSEGQGPRVETLPGGEALSSGVDDLLYFNNAILRGLGIPSSYIPSGGEDSQAIYNDGKVGVSFLSEWRFSQFCQRIQKLFQDTLDYEYKLFVKRKGIQINSGDFTLEFEEPQSFGDYRRMEKDQTMLNVLQQADGVDYFSKRFVLKRFGGLTEEEILENERLWKEENKGKVKDKVADIDINNFEEVSLNTVGIKKENGDENEIDRNVPE
jgi:hypothetical protein